MRRALVLGGGGPVGIAWEIGVLAGLAEAGVDLAGVDAMIGTSAGSIVGALMASGRSPATLYAEHLEMVRRTADRVVAAPDLTPLIQFMMRRPPEGPAPDALMAEMGAYALQAATPYEADYLDMIGGLFKLGEGWPARFSCTAVDAETGAFRTWTSESGVDTLRAVASSCAVPGVYPPVTIEGRRYIDGGVRSPTNIDLAQGFDEVIVLAVTMKPFAGPMEDAARRELAPLAAAGGRTILMVPNDEALDAFGFNLMDTARREVVAEAGLRQGRGAGKAFAPA